MPTLIGHSGVTVLEALGGMAISLACALVLGVLMDAQPVIKQCLYPILVVTQTVPYDSAGAYTDTLPGVWPYA